MYSGGTYNNEQENEKKLIKLENKSKELAEDHEKIKEMEKTLKILKAEYKNNVIKLDKEVGEFILRDREY